MIVAAFAASFWVPALRATDGEFPAPLDDVYIHFDFARAAARGHPFAWIAGQGYSSGETAPAYALVLAAGWAIGFRGGALGWFAALVAIAALVLALRALARAFEGASWAIVATTATLLLACGHVGFGVFSGMELALHVLFLLRALQALGQCEHASPLARPRSELALGLWGALLVWTRPESVVIVGPLAVAAARARGASSAWWATMLRAAGPAAGATFVVAALNRAFTGEWQSAGALLKLLSSNPFLTDVDRARELVVNLVHFTWKVLTASLVATPALLAVLLALALYGVRERALRDRTGALLAAASLYALLVSWNGAARYQNFRYYVPAVVCFLLAVAHGAWALELRFRARAAGALLLAGAAASALLRAEPQRAFFRRAAANIHGQQVEAGRDLATRMAPGERVLLGDAGAIPWFSDRGAIDALGLGGYDEMPFARAATLGEPATVELLQRLPAHERPTYLALYPNWFAGITRTFGTELRRITITDNVICGGDTKIIYRADWSALDRDVAPAGVVDELDVADPVSERAHAYASPAPRGGWPILAVRKGSGGDAFDAGRITPAGSTESFTVDAEGPVTLVLRSDEAIDALVEGEEPILQSELRADAVPGGWTEARVRLAAAHRVTLRARSMPLRDFHVWIVR